VALELVPSFETGLESLQTSMDLLPNLAVGAPAHIRIDRFAAPTP
jgi:hypothetical protein